MNFKTSQWSCYPLHQDPYSAGVYQCSRFQFCPIIRISLPDAETLMKQYDAAIAEFLAGKPMVIDTSLPEGKLILLLILENPTNLPFSRELWEYNLSEYVAKVNEPVLVVIGKKDLQIDWKTDGMALEIATTKKPAITFVYPEYANHVLKHEKAPRDELTGQSVIAL